MKNTLFYIILPLLFLSCESDEKIAEPITEEVELKSPSSFFDDNKTKVLVVGTFHFDYPGMDIHQIKESDKVDVLSPDRQKEMTELLEYIKRFKPNKIAIEANSDWQATEKLRNYTLEIYGSERDERYQIAMRLASELELDTIYSIDAGNLYLDFEKTNKEFLDGLTFDSESISVDSAVVNQFENWRTYSNELLKDVTLLEYFKYMNTREYHQYDYGNYLIDFFKLDNQRGADILSIWWYNRNLRIFSKIQELTESKDDRILVLFGNGHAAVLRQLLECSVEYEYVEFGEL